MTPRDPLPPINFSALAAALLDRIDQLLPVWLPGGVKRGNEYVCGSVFGGAGSSCSVNITNGLWKDFQANQAGKDLISLYAENQELNMGKAALQVAREEGLEDVAGVRHAHPDAAPAEKSVRPAPVVKKTESEKESWTTIRPVPGHAPAPTFWHPFRNCEKHQDPIDHIAEYRTGDDLHGYVVRFMTSTGDKDTLPHTWCLSDRDGTSKWHWKGFDEPRPLYLPSFRLPSAGETVVLVEGEKKAGILQAVLDAVAPGVYLVVSWLGGCNGWKKADWSWLKGCTVLLWPDCDSKREPLTKKEHDSCLDKVGLAAMQAIKADPLTKKERDSFLDEVARSALQALKPLLPVHKQPGMAAMLGIGMLLRAGHSCIVQLLPIPEPLAVMDGWDCADAISTDGWTGERVLGLFAQAYALPLSDSDAAVATPEKKSTASLAPESGDDEGDGFELIGNRRIPSWLAPYYNKEKKCWMASRKMVILILERDPTLEPVLAYNELSNNVQSRVLWPWPHAQVGDVTDAVDLLLGKYLTDTYGLPSIARAALTEAIQTVAHTRRFHPIREYLQSRVWDKTSRIDKWLIHALGESPDTLSPAMREYLQIVGRCWLLGMVNRVMNPGCKFDYCPVLEGVGGLRKSTMVEILGGSQFYSDTPFDVGRGKEAQEQVQGLWVYEIAELANFSKADIGAIKAFISSKVDRYRVAYGTTVGSFARQCLLVGTTNENTYLRDRSGNRRFWPIPVKHTINTEWLIKYRDQLLAEAYELFGQGLAFTPTPDQEKRLFQPMQESRLVETAVQSELQNVLTRPPVGTGIGSIVNDLANFVTIANLTLALQVDAGKSTPALEAQIRGWLDHQGWERVKKQVNGARAWGYVRPAAWPPVETDDDMTAAPPGVAADTTQDGDDVPF